MIKATQVPDLFSDFKKIPRNAFLKNAHINQQAASTFETMKIMDGISDLDDATIKTIQRTAVTSFNAFQRELLGGAVELYYCDEDMSGMIEIAAKALTHEDIADPSGLMSERGFCYFAEGIPVNNSIVHAIFWGPASYITQGSETEYGYQVAAYNDRFNEKDKTGTMFWDALTKETGVPAPNARWVYKNTSGYVSGDPLAPSPDMFKVANASGDNLYNISPTAILHCLMLMINQPPEVITVEKKKSDNKKQLKRLKKENIPSEVVVVDIRHRYQPSSTPSTSKAVEWSRRWLVSGHWAWRATKEGRVRRWIMPYIKGPDDKPFIATKRVIALLK